MENSVLCHVTAYKKQGGEYRLMPYKIKKPLCEFLEEDKYFYDDFCANSTMINPFPCPYPIGNIQVNGYTPSLKNIPSTIIPSGDYRLHFSLKKQQKEVVLAKIWGSVVQL